MPIKRDTSYLNRDPRPPQPEVVPDPVAEQEEPAAEPAPRDETLPDQTDVEADGAEEEPKEKRDPYAPQPGTPGYRREEISRRLREQRAAEHEHDVESSNYDFIAPPVARQEAADAADGVDEKGAPVSDQPENYTLNVHGKLFSADKTQLLALAQVSEDNFEAWGPERVVALAQTQLAAQQVLEEAKAASREARRSLRADPAAADQGDQEGGEEQTELQDEPKAPSQTREERRRELVQKMQYGNEDEAAEAHAELTDMRLEELNSRGAVRRREDDVKQALTDFARDNQDIAADSDVADVTLKRLVYEGRREAAEALGLSYEDALKKYPNPGDVGEALATAVRQGKQVRHVRELLDAAGDYARSRFSMPRNEKPASRTPGPAGAVAHDRTRAKEALPSTPQRASRPVSVAPATPPKSATVSDRIAQIRARTGKKY